MSHPLANGIRVHVRIGNTTLDESDPPARLRRPRFNVVVFRSSLGHDGTWLRFTISETPAHPALFVSLTRRCVTQGLTFTGNRSWYECAGLVQSYIGN